jgi:hypothetical protein
MMYVTFYINDNKESVFLTGKASNLDPMTVTPRELETYMSTPTPSRDATRLIENYAHFHEVSHFVCVICERRVNGLSRDKFSGMFLARTDPSLDSVISMTLSCGRRSCLSECEQRFTKPKTNKTETFLFAQQLRDRVCGQCGKCELASVQSKTHFKVCSRCWAVHYCSAVCQLAHWRAGHKNECSVTVDIDE